MIAAKKENLLARGIPNHFGSLGDDVQTRSIRQVWAESGVNVVGLKCRPGSWGHRCGKIFQSRSSCGRFEEKQRGKTETGEGCDRQDSKYFQTDLHTGCYLRPIPSVQIVRIP